MNDQIGVAIADENMDLPTSSAQFIRKIKTYRS